jgi:two-component system chemotaxis sensor kinase CheA
VRVNTDTLDRFLSTVGEVILNSNQLRTSAGASAASKTAGMAGGLDRMDRVVGELQRRALELRTTPLLRIVEPLPRVAREVAQLGGKRVEVEIQGAELDLDRSILDRLSDPLVHLVRNAVDHGIETPEVRAAAGKPEVGCVTIDARRVKDSIRARWSGAWSCWTWPKTCRPRTSRRSCSTRASPPPRRSRGSPGEALAWTP